MVSHRYRSQFETRVPNLHIVGGEQGRHSGSQDMLVMVASAGTAEDAIVASRLAAGSTEDARQDRIALVWLR